MKKQFKKELEAMLLLKQAMQSNVGLYPFVNLEGLDEHIMMLEDKLKGLPDDDTVTIEEPKPEPMPKPKNPTYNGLKCRMSIRDVSEDVLNGKYNMGQDDEFRRDKVQAMVDKARKVFNKHEDVVIAHEKMFFHICSRVLWCKYSTNVGIRDDKIVVEFFLKDTVDFKKMQYIASNHFKEYQLLQYYSNSHYLVVLRKIIEVIQ